MHCVVILAAMIEGATGMICPVVVVMDVMGVDSLMDAMSCGIIIFCCSVIWEVVVVLIDEVGNRRWVRFVMVYDEPSLIFDSWSPHTVRVAFQINTTPDSAYYNV